MTERDERTSLLNELLAERILVLDTFRCPGCPKLEFFDLDASLPNG